MHITFVPNWLERKDRLALDKERARNKNDAFYGKQEKVDEASLRLDWDGLRALANALFETTDEFDSILDDFIEKMRKESIDYTKKQENQFDKDSLLYYPTVQYTERLRQKVTEVILMSLTLDFLTSSLTDDVDKLEATLKNTKNHRFSLTPLSLWRAYTILTTVSYGTTELELKDNAPSINFSDFLDNYKAEDQRVEQMIGYIKQERGNFKSALEEIWKNHQDAVKDASSSSAMVNCLQDNTIVTQDIERILLLTKK